MQGIVGYKTNWRQDWLVHLQVGKLGAWLRQVLVLVQVQGCMHHNFLFGAIKSQNRSRWFEEFKRYSNSSWIKRDSGRKRMTKGHDFKVELKSYASTWRMLGRCLYTCGRFDFEQTFKVCMEQWCCLSLCCNVAILQKVIVALMAL